MGEDFKLADSSALVLRWTGDGFYETAQARDYLSRLDLSRGEALYRRCQNIWPHYGEVIKNRKYAVRHLCGAHVQEQIIFAGAGLDAMGLELAARHPHARIYELDLAHMSNKQHMADCDNIFCLSVDLSDAGEARAALLEAGWQPSQPSLLVFEGISYYVSSAALSSLVLALSPRLVIIEYLLPPHMMNSRAREISEGVFGAVRAQCDIGALSRYTSSRLSKLLGRRVLDVWPMSRQEARRTKRADYFADQDFRWIEIAVFK